MDKCNVSTKDLAGEIRKAKKAGLLADKTEPRAIAAKYDRKSNRIIIDLRSGVSFMFPTSLAEGLSDATCNELAQVKVLADGFAIFWENIDVVLSVPDLLMGVFGSKNWMAKVYSEIGRKGGSKTSPAKAKASKTNGLLGGRPRKVSVA